MDQGLLDGIRVLDLGVAWSVPFAGRLFADLGAEVIKIESTQRWAPYVRGTHARPTKESIQYMGTMGRAYVDQDPGPRPWNRGVGNGVFVNKLSMTVCLDKPKGLEMFKRLVKVSDILIENNAVGMTDSLGISYEVLKEVNPKLIYISAPLYGCTGPYSMDVGFGNQAEALAGLTLRRGYRDMSPTTTSFTFWMDDASGRAIVFAALAALHYRQRTGKGQFIDISQLENLIGQLGEDVMDYTMNGRVQQRLGNRDPRAAPCGCYRCKGEDRWANITVYSDEQWQGFCGALGDPPWTKEEQFSDVLSRYKNQDELDKHVEEWTLRHDNYEVMEILQREGVPAGPVMNERDCCEDPHIKARHFYETATHPETGSAPEYGQGSQIYPGIAWKLSKTPGRIRKSPARLGEDNEYVYKQLIGVSDEEYTELEKECHIGMDYAEHIL